MVLMGGLLMGGFVFSADWPEWRGPERNGLASESPPLVDAFPEGGPKKLWESEELYAKANPGHASVVVSGGLAYAFVNLGFSVPTDERVLAMGHLNALGYAPDMPAELLKAAEDARVSDARKNLKTGKEIEPWVNEWLKANVKPEQKKFAGIAQARLRAGDAALPLDLLAKLAAIADKVFPNQEAFDQWFKDNGIDEAVKKQATKWVAKTKPAARDFVCCLDAQTGKTLWKTDVQAAGVQSYGASSTPSVANGRCYLLTSAAVLTCLDATTGAEVWKQRPFEKPPGNPCSSVVVVDGVVIASGDETVGLNAGTGEVLWKAKRLEAGNPSPAVWKTPDKTCVIINSRQMTCLEAKTGKVLWTAPGGGFSTPAVVGDTLAFIVANKLVAYQLAPDKAQKLWEVPFADEYASPLICKDYVYAVGAAPRNGKEGRAVCVELKTGKLAWEGVVAGAAQYSSPVLADGKLVAFAGPSLCIIKASPQQYAPLGLGDVKADGWTSPAVADGKVFFRSGTKVVCYTLAK
jgi:outer membrane protein assembly factor BamB